MASWKALALFVFGIVLAIGGVGCASMLGYDDVGFGDSPDGGGATVTANAGDGGAQQNVSTQDGAVFQGTSDGGPINGCIPSCASKTCGASDGCGGKCTACPASGLTCDQATWTCKNPNPTCTPSCAGKKCGDADGCNGVCTGCSGTNTCNTVTKQCVASCTPSCAGKTCGQSDGCAGKCGGCPTGQVCDMNAAACAPLCVPNCTGKVCGEADGCGGKCTTCPTAGQGCDTTTGQCAACTKDCGGHGTCVFGWESGQHCQCDAGYYDTIQVGGCLPSTGTACDGKTCGGHGTCSSSPPFFGAECKCEGDYIEYGGTCAPLHKLRCIDRDGKLQDKGAIRCTADDTGYEVCRDGDGDGNVEWVASGSASCTAGSTCSVCKGTKCDAGDGSGGQACPTGTVCMSKVHEVDVYQCVAGCDCTNCGTCDPGQFTGYQRACGSSGNTFDGATIACKSPCAHANEGCLPYGQFAFCFPSEGCASAAPQ